MHNVVQPADHPLVANPIIIWIRRRPLVSLLAALVMAVALLAAGCQDRDPPSPAYNRVSTDKFAAEIAQESQRLNAWFQARYEDRLTRSPMLQTRYGIKDNQHRLDDVSQLADDETAALTESWLKEMRDSFDPDRLDAQARLSYQLFEFASENSLKTHAVSGHDYVFQHMNGPHTGLPSFMINVHAVDTVEDAQAYIHRLSAFPAYLGAYSQKAQAQFEAGVVLPGFVYPKIIQASENVINGAPFNAGASENSPLWDDINTKIETLDIAPSEKSRLRAEARGALLEYVRPAYTDLIAVLRTHAETATDDDGAWKLPNGADYYQVRLRHYTTTDMTPDEIHQIGLAEVARIQAEMQDIINQVGFDGSLQDFYTFLRTDPQFQYSNDAAGRERYITEATAMIDTMKGEMNALFLTQPKADMIVKRVEPFREDTAFSAFYNRPALDGSRPGTYYINLRDVGDQPTYLMQALAYHEGIPGHHMQIAIAQELQGLPKFRTLGGYTSYVEGWALYAESLPKELGLYTDPYKDFGRLSMEIFRAARLVVDTGIHSQKWTREQAVQYMLDTIANPEGDIRAEIDRYIVWPGQATAYKIGMLKIQDLRKKAETELGSQFDIAEFHDIILTHGPVPLTVLETLVNDWITAKR